MTIIPVLGCGPAGLLVAHAVAQAGHEPLIYSRKEPSPIGGAQFLHQHIPGVSKVEPEGFINFVFIGTRRGYAQKVYKDPLAPVSWGNYQPGLHPIWNLREMYQRLWEMYENKILDCELDLPFVKAMAGDGPVFSTIPATTLCEGGHEFQRQDVWITPSAPHAASMTIVYNGSALEDWYRSSSIFGVEGTEWPVKPSGQGDAVRVRKPLRTNCGCTPEVSRFGRYGVWDKPILVHNAYNDAFDLASSL